MSNDFWIILTGALVAINCGVLGAFLLLRKSAMIGDAISHSVLPGIVAAYLIAGTLNSFPMLIGAAITGVLTSVFIEFLKNKLAIQGDAAIGIVYTLLFSIGVILISANLGNIELDQECVLYGELAFVPLDMQFINNQPVIPTATFQLLVLLVVVSTFIILFFKPLTITTFHSEYAKSKGYNTLFWHYSLMSLVALATVLSFESVGAFMVVALMIIPPATAYLLTSKLKVMLWLTVVFGVTASILGYYFSAAINTSIAAAITVVAGIQLLLAYFVYVIQYQRIAIFNK